jgi:hypothetical protein
MFFIPAQDAIWRIVLGIFTTIAYMALLLGCRPYRQPDLNVLAAIGAQFALALSMVTVLGMRIFDDITARYDLGGAQSIMRIDSKSQVRTHMRGRYLALQSETVLCAPQMWHAVHRWLE